MIKKEIFDWTILIDFDFRGSFLIKLLDDNSLLSKLHWVFRKIYSQNIHKQIVIEIDETWEVIAVEGKPHHFITCLT